MNTFQEAIEAIEENQDAQMKDTMDLESTISDTQLSITALEFIVDKYDQEQQERSFELETSITNVEKAQYVQHTHMLYLEDSLSKKTDELRQYKQNQKNINLIHLVTCGVCVLLSTLR